MADQVTRSAARLSLLIALPVAVVAGVGAFSWLGGFDKAGPAPAASVRPQITTPVPMSAAPLATEQAVPCRALLSQLPDTIRELRPRPVTAGSEQNAAYGDPAITVACGVAATTVAPTDLVQLLDGVCWRAEVRPGSSVWTTLDRQVPVSVTVPNGYESPGQWTIEFSRPIVATILSLPAERVPTGCR